MFFKKINHFLTGNSEPRSYKFKEIFSLSFKKHSKNYNHQYDEFTFIPKPWIWLRVFGFLLLLSFIYYSIVYSGGVLLAFPWFSLVTASIIPITVAVFLYESNIKESVSLINILIIFFVGTAFAFVSLININIGVGNQAIYAAFIAPFIEEIAKLIPIMIAILLLKTKRLSSAVLIGWLVGAGFEIAETLGYATYYGFEAVFSNSTSFIMPDANTLILRSLIAFGSHGLWGAIEGAAFHLSHQQENKKFITKRFLAWMGLSIAFHLMWNSNAFFISSENVSNIIMIILQAMMIGVFIFIMDACIRDNKLSIQSLINEDNVNTAITEGDKGENVS